MIPPTFNLTEEVWNNLPIQEKALHWAASQLRLNAREIPAGSNWGPFVKIYLRAALLFSPAFWCAAFGYWCIRQAGFTKKGPKIPASTKSWIAWAYKNKVVVPLDQVQRGDIVVYYKEGVGGHLMFAADNVNNVIRTIEGNSNTDGSRNGQKVCELHRLVSDLKQKPNCIGVRWYLA